MSYLPEERAYLFVIKDTESPVFPMGLDQVDSYTVPIGEGLVQVIGIPKSLKMRLSGIKLKSLELVKKVKDKNFVIIVSPYNNQLLLVLAKNSAVWLTKIAPKYEKNDVIEQIKDYTSLAFNQEVGRVLVETELESSSRFSFKMSKKYLIYGVSFVVVAIIGLLISYLIDQYI